LEKDKTERGYLVFFLASYKCGIKVVEAILDKKVDIDGLSDVSIVNFYYICNGYYY
jgi:hypothetical protein